MIEERDLILLHLIGKFRFLLGRHIISFSKSSKRTTYRQIEKLINLKYVKKEYILYGVAPLYTLTHKGRLLIGLNKRENKFRLEQIHHDILVVDTALYLVKKDSLNINSLMSEKELHAMQGFASRQHVPDLSFTKNVKSYAIEIELSLKPYETLKKNAEINFINFDYQLWFVEKDNRKLISYLEKLTGLYPNICILYLEVLKEDDKI